MAYKIDALTPYERLYEDKCREKTRAKEKKEKKHTTINAQDVLLVLIGFFLGKSLIMNELSPFVFPFFAYVFAKTKKPWIALSAFPGLFLMQSGLYGIRAIITFVLMFWFIEKLDKSSVKTWKLALVSSLVVFGVGIVFQRINGNYLYDFLLLVIESIMTYSLIFIFSAGMPLVLGGIRRKIISNEELICGTILLSLILLGIGNISIFGLSIKHILGITCILTFARHFGSGAGASVGIVVGVVTSLTSVVTPSVIGVYAFGGLLAGVFKDLGKIPVALGFILGNLSLTFYINGSTEAFISSKEILIATLFLLTMPTKIENRISSLKGIDSYRQEREKMYGDRVREVTMDRLKDYSKVFEQIGKSFEQVAISSALLSKDDLDEVYDRLTQEVCSSCSLCSKCWEDNFYYTYQEIFGLLNKLEKVGEEDQKELEDALNKKCIHSDKLLQTLKHLYENYKLNQFWKKQIMESKNLVSQQLDGISDVIYDLSKDMSRDIVFKKEEEEEILIAFDKQGIPIKDIMVIENAQGRCEVTVHGDPCHGKNYCHSDIKTMISQVLGKEMVMEKHICNGNGVDNQCRVTYTEKINYNITTGIVKVSKNPGEESGDTYTSIPLQDGKHMLAISDGMGSGQRAAKESRTTINLLENFLEAGFNREVALKTINSILMLRSSDEMFSTIDLSIVDQYNGVAEFIKIGAVSTFIKKKSKVCAITCNSLPVGILNEVNLDVSRRQLEDGDFIIMITDGLLDAIPYVEDKEKWIIERLEKINSKNPQRIAQGILDKVKQECKNDLVDDTTVLVSKIWKNGEN